MRKKKQIEELETKEEALITLDEFALDYAQMRHEQEQISNRTYNSYLQILRRGILIGLLTGVRISEMLALTWEDYSKGTLRINKSLERDSQVSKCTKNGEDRYITCPPSLIQILKSWKPIQQTYFKDKLYVDWSRNSPIVNAKWGNYQTQSNFRRWVRFHSEEYNIPDNFYFHKLRHTYVTFLYRNCGVDEETTRKLSGHKSPQAFKGYTHTNDEYKRKATDKLDAIFTSMCDNNCCKGCSFWSPSPTKDKGTCWLSNTPQITDKNHTCDNFSAI